MRGRVLAIALGAFVAVGVLFGCSAVLGINDAKDRGQQPDGSTDQDGGQTTASKVDVLLVVDSAPEMHDKVRMFAGSLGPLIDSVIVGNDVHLGVIGTSLGTPGGDLCSTTSAGPDARAHLATRGPGDQLILGPIVAPSGVLSYNPQSDEATFITNAGLLVSGLGSGCGVEAQLESAYRFLVQPDPWMSVTVENSVAKYVGVDSDLLAQRRAFLRPDSLVVVVLLTDRDDAIMDPRSVGGQGWAFMNTNFPGSTQARPDGKGTTAPRGTSVCATDPGSPDCASCGSAATCNASDPACQKIKADPNCKKSGGYYTDAEDSLNTRFVRMKQRFGVDPQFPISRYVDGFSSSLVPDRDGEHTIIGGTTSPYLGTGNCTNPLFAAALPSSSSEELCNLPVGPRGKNLILFAVIGGAPPNLVGASPDWPAVIGADPANYDYTGLSPYMIPSTTPRVGLEQPSSVRGYAGSDPINGREWTTDGKDLEYACIYQRQRALSCTAYSDECDCADVISNPPICGMMTGDEPRGKAYPSTRELRVAAALGDRGVAGSICTASGSYRSALQVLADTIAPRIVAP